MRKALLLFGVVAVCASACVAPERPDAVSTQEAKPTYEPTPAPENSGPEYEATVAHVNELRARERERLKNEPRDPEWKTTDAAAEW